jgi:hypothetical protein
MMHYGDHINGHILTRMDVPTDSSSTATRPSHGRASSFFSFGVASDLGTAMVLFAQACEWNLQHEPSRVILANVDPVGPDPDYHHISSLHELELLDLYS